MANKLLSKVEQKINVTFLKWKNYPKISRILFTLLFLIVIPFVVLGLLKQTTVFQKKATGSAVPSFYFNPSTATLSPGQEFLTTIYIDTAGQLTSAAAVQISYPPADLEITQVNPGKYIDQSPAMFPNILRNLVDSQNGKIFLDAGVDLLDPAYYTRTGIFCQIKFRVKPLATGGQKKIAFYLANPSDPTIPGDTDIIGADDKTGNDKTGIDILKEVGNLTLTIINAVPTPTNVPNCMGVGRNCTSSPCCASDGTVCTFVEKNYWTCQKSSTVPTAKPIVSPTLTVRPTVTPTKTPTPTLRPTNTPPSRPTTTATPLAPTQTPKPTATLTPTNIPNCLGPWKSCWEGGPPCCSGSACKYESGNKKCVPG